MFESQASVGGASNVIVYPRVEALPALEAAAGIHRGHPRRARCGRRTPRPHATSIRAYAPGDPYNRIHWKSTARNSSCRSRNSTSSRPPTCGSSSTCNARAHTGSGDESTLEYGVRVAASVAARGAAREPQRRADRVGRAHRPAAGRPRPAPVPEDHADARRGQADGDAAARDLLVEDMPRGCAAA